MPRLRFPVPISIVLFLALTFAGTYFVRRQILRRHFRIAMSMQDEGTICDLLHTWPCPVSPNGYYRNLFFYAASWGSRDLADELARQGFDPLFRDNIGLTPLDAAASYGNLAMAEFLIARGADVNARYDLGWTPLHSAAHNYGTPAVAALLISKGALVDARDSRGLTPLHFASMTSKAAVIRVLISAGADVEARSSSGETPLYMAADQLKPQAVQALLESGASVSAKDASGRTPLTIARQTVARASEGARKEVIDLLTQHGAKE